MQLVKNKEKAILHLVDWRGASFTPRDLASQMGRWRNGNQSLAFSTINITILIVCINLQTANLPKCHYIALIRHK